MNPVSHHPHDWRWNAAREQAAAEEELLSRLFALNAKRAAEGGRSARHPRRPRPGDPRVNIQDAKGRAKPYQVRQVLKAIDKLESIQ